VISDLYLVISRVLPRTSWIVIVGTRIGPVPITNCDRFYRIIFFHAYVNAEDWFLVRVCICISYPFRCVLCRESWKRDSEPHVNRPCHPGTRYVIMSRGEPVRILPVVVAIVLCVKKKTIGARDDGPTWAVQRAMSARTGSAVQSLTEPFFILRQN
jgi:hypothetical protein